MNQQLVFDTRELKEIAHAIHYYRFYQHGTVGHNLLVITAKLALDRGFELGDTGAVEKMTVPEDVVVTGKGV